MTETTIPSALHVLTAQYAPTLDSKTASTPPIAAPAVAPATDDALPKAKPKRTPGLRLFDVFLYPMLTNVGVFAISVWATYMTSHGDKRNEAGELIHGRLGEIIHERGTKLMNYLEGKMGMSHGTADMTKMVAFSFIDGSIMAPFVKLLEDRREKIAKNIDSALGTKPDDESVYAAEPKQGWLSVLGGRFATAGIVVPTAVLLENTGFKNGELLTKKGAAAAGKEFVGFNDSMFTRAGEALAKKFPSIGKLFGKHTETKGLGKILAFEAFYTSVCTGGLYMSSRLIARLTGKHLGDDKKAEATTVAPAGTNETAAIAAVQEEKPVLTVTPKPAAVVTKPIDPTFTERTAPHTHDAAVEKSINTLITKLSAKAPAQAWQARVEEVHPEMAGLAKA